MRLVLGLHTNGWSLDILITRSGMSCAPRRCADALCRQCQGPRPPRVCYCCCCREGRQAVGAGVPRVTPYGTGSRRSGCDMELSLERIDLTQTQTTSRYADPCCMPRKIGHISHTPPTGQTAALLRVRVLPLTARRRGCFPRARSGSSSLSPATRRARYSVLA